MTEGIIHEPTTIIAEENLRVDETSRIDAFCLINAKGGARLREQSVVHAGSHVVGVGEFDMGPRSVVTYNCTILTSTADLRYPASSVVPEEERRAITGDITFERETFVGSGAVVMPGVTLHEGAVVAANTYVDEDVPEWSIRYPDGSTGRRPLKNDSFPG